MRAHDAWALGAQVLTCGGVRIQRLPNRVTKEKARADLSAINPAFKNVDAISIP